MSSRQSFLVMRIASPFYGTPVVVSCIQSQDRNARDKMLEVKSMIVLVIIGVILLLPLMVILDLVKDYM